MGLTKLLKTTVREDSPFDGSLETLGGAGEETSVSEFLTIQSLANFTAMTGAISAAWAALRTLEADWFSSNWVPFCFAVAFGIISILISTDALKNNGSFDLGRITASIFISLLNSLVLFSAVIGTATAMGK